jgi:DNA replication protein DnaC
MRTGEIKSFDLESCRPKVYLDKALQLSLIPEEYKDANLYNAIIDKHNRDLFDDLKPIIVDIVNEVGKGSNFIFNSPHSGTGKTYLGSVILNHFIYKASQRKDIFNYEDPVGMFIDFAELMDSLRYSEDDLQDSFDQMKNVPLLLLDDIGSCTMTDFVREQMFLIVNYRCNHRLSTIVTSNYTVSQWQDEKLFGKRISSRLTKNACIIEDFGVIDRR